MRIVHFCLPLFFYGSAALAIVNGRLADGLGPIDRSTVGLAKKNADGSFRIFCSASLYNENTIVTAAHCLRKHPEEKFVFFGLSIQDPNAQTLRVTAERFHEENLVAFKNDDVDVKDIAVARFEGKVPPPYRAMPLLREDTSLKNGAEVTIAGYGYSHYSGGYKTGAGTLRTVTMRITDANSAQTEVLIANGETGTCPIDSGGPGFIEIDGIYYLWGATSRSSVSTPCGAGRYTQVHKFASWIEKAIRDLESETIAKHVCRNEAAVLVVDTFDGDPTNQRDVDLNGDGTFDIYHGDLTEKLVQLSGRPTIRANISTPVFSTQLLQVLTDHLEQIEAGKLKVSWINFSQGYSVPIDGLNRFVNRQRDGRVRHWNVHKLAPTILKNLAIEKPQLKIAELVQVFEAFGRLGIPIVVAAGNSGFSEVNFYSLFPNVISVGALDNQGRRTPYSSENSAVTMWRKGEIKSYAMPTGVDLNGDRKSDFEIRTTPIGQETLDWLNGKLAHEIASPFPAHLQQGNDNNTATFFDVIKKLPAGLYSTRDILRRALATPFHQAKYMQDSLGDYFYMDGVNPLPLTFVPTATDNRIIFDRYELYDGYQLRTTIKGTSFAAPNLCD